MLSNNNDDVEDKSDKIVLENLHSILRSSVKDQMLSDVPLGAFYLEV